MKVSMFLGWMMCAVTMIAASHAIAQDVPSAKTGTTSPKAPVGLFVCRGPNPTPEREVNFRFIDGWLVRPGWDRVEPVEGEYDWSYIDSEIALAKRLNKRITLCVLGGPQTPAWVYSAGARQFEYTMPMRKGRTMKIPLLWDEVYLKKWMGLVRALGEKYNRNDTIVLVHMTGATGNGLEMQLPFMPHDREQWNKIGYMPQKVIAAWEQIIDTFALAFCSKPLDIDVHPVLGSDQVAQEVAAYGSEKLGKRFGIFGGWLSGKSAEQDRHHAGLHAIAAKYGPTGFAAFQMIASQTPNRSNPAFSNLFAEGGLKTAMEQAMGWNARYFEIWESDAMNVQLHPLLKELATRLKE